MSLDGRLVVRELWRLPSVSVMIEVKPCSPIGKTPSHLHFDIDIDTDELDSEVQRLVDLGAQVVERFDSHVWMRDPEQNDFCVTSKQMTNESPPDP